MSLSPHAIFNDSLRPILSKVARSFYLSLRVLPKRMRSPMALAYLLARAADTIADTQLLPAERRLEWLRVLRSAVQDAELIWPQEKFAADLLQVQTIPEERELLGEIPALQRLFWQLPIDMREAVAAVLNILIEGMESDLLCGRCDTWETLDRYCYLVAGCVGPFWTRMMAMASPRFAKRVDLKQLEAWGIDFGKGLQMINIIKDVAKDRLNDRAYWPCSEDAMPRFRGPMIERALDYLENGERYLLAIPARYYRYRLAALWPLWIGLETLLLLARDETLLDAKAPHKISRDQLRRIIARSLTAAPFNTSIARWCAWYRHQIKQAVG